MPILEMHLLAGRTVDERRRRGGNASHRTQAGRQTGLRFGYCSPSTERKNFRLAA